MKQILTILALTLCSCRFNQKKEILDTTNNISIQKELNFNDFMTLNKLEAIKKYGTPNNQEKFILDDAQGEFRNGISEIYTQQERQSQTILIDELTWEKDNSNWITVWYQIEKDQSTPKKVFTWNKGSEF